MRWKKSKRGRLTALFLVLLMMVSNIMIIRAPAVQAEDGIIPDTPDGVINPELVVYDAPSGAVPNGSYTVQVRPEGGIWQDLFEYDVRVDLKWDEVERHSSFVYFDSDFSKRIEVKVVKNSGTADSVRIRPSSAGITYDKNGNEVTFFLDEPRKLSVEFNGDIYDNLQLFANPVETNPPQPDDPNVIYYGPGIHEIAGNGTLTLTSDQTVYIAGGAIVKGSISSNGANNIKILGRGILDGSRFEAASSKPRMIYIRNASGLTIDGIIITDAKSWCIVPRDSDNVTITNIKELSHAEFSDGINPVGCQNMLVEDVFIRNGDDCISIKAQGVEGNSDITIRNSVFWTDAAHGILIGPEGNGTTTERVTFENNDILELNCPSATYWGAMAITNGGNQTIKDITFKDVRVENFTLSNLLDIRIEQNMYASQPGKCISNVLFKNITYTGANANRNVLLGFDPERYVDGITFENLVINGEQILNAAQGNISIGGYVTNAVFRTGDEPAQETPAPVPTPIPIPTGELPEGWHDADIGTCSLPGSSGYDDGTFTLKGSGDQFRDPTDSFHYLYKQITGDCTIVARVASMTNTQTLWAKAGVMIRESTDTSSKFASMAMRPIGAGSQWRDGTGTHTAWNESITMPGYIKLTRTGDKFNAYYSGDGTAWIRLGNEETVPMNSTVCIGLMVFAGNNGLLCTSVFDHVEITNENTVPTATPQATLTGPGQVGENDQSFALSYGLQGAQDVSAQHITLTYDTSLFEYLGVELQKDDTFVDSHENPSGTVSIVIAGEGPDNAISGDVPDILSIAFKPLAPGTGTIAITGVTLSIEGGGDEISATPASKTITVQPAGADKSALEAALSQAWEIYDNAVEGILPGQYPDGTKERILKAAIDDATLVLENETATQAVVDEAVAALDAAVERFEGLAITESTGDINHDERFSIGDLGIVAYYYGTHEGQDGWDEVKDADINGDGEIGLYELAFIARRVLDY